MTDCHVIANDLDSCRLSPFPHYKEFQRFGSLESCQKYLNRSDSRHLDSDVSADNILRMATLLYHKATKKLVYQFLKKLDTIKTIPIFILAAHKILAAVFVEFASQILMWRDSFQDYRSGNRAEFILECDALRAKFAKIPETAKTAEDQLRTLFRENAVYIPIMPPAQVTFNPNDAKRLIAEYSAEFNAQFDNDTPLHTKLRLKAQEARAKSLLGKMFSSKSVYLQNYSEFLEKAVLTINVGAWKLEATQNWSSYLSKLQDFVAALNGYGNGSFQLIHSDAVK